MRWSIAGVCPNIIGPFRPLRNMSYTLVTSTPPDFMKDQLHKLPYTVYINLGFLFFLKVVDQFLNTSTFSMLHRLSV